MRNGREAETIRIKHNARAGLWCDVGCCRECGAGMRRPVESAGRPLRLRVGRYAAMKGGGEVFNAEASEAKHDAIPPMIAAVIIASVFLPFFFMPRIIPQPQDKIKPPPKKSAGALHQSTNNQLRLGRANLARIRAEVVLHVPLKISVKRREVQVVEESLMVNNTFTQITIKTDDDKTGFSESSAPGSCRSAWGCRSKETSPPHHVHHKRTECR